MVTLTTAEVVLWLLASAQQAGLNHEDWPDYAMRALEEPHRYWQCQLPEMETTKFRRRLAPLQYDEQRAGWPMPVAQFTSYGDWWDVMCVPEEPGAVLVAGGFDPDGPPVGASRWAEPARHQLFIFRYLGLSQPGCWSFEAVDAPERLSPWALEQLRKPQPPAQPLQQAA